MSYEVIDAIRALTTNPEVSISGECVDKIILHDGNPSNITKQQILDKQAELKTAYENNKYQRDRAVAYPSIKDQLDDLYHNGIDGWKTTIKAVKDKYPKG